jgi:co-chaperonin GroES (HSP10)
MKIKTLNDYIIVKEDSDKINDPNAIFKDHSKVLNKGKVIKAEEEALKNSIIYYSNRYEKMKIEGEDVIIMKTDNIIAVVLE